MITGQVFSISVDNRPIPGCTVSETVWDGADYIAHFSMGAGTDISASYYPYYKLLVIAEGETEVTGLNCSLRAGQAILTPANTSVGVRAVTPAVYTEISLRGKLTMNAAIQPGQVFALADSVPYQAGKIVNMDVVSNAGMKLALMAFDAGTGLPEHAAPGEAIIFALDGEGIIVYEGQEYTIHAGENFAFARGGMHAVKAEKPFKMALLLILG